MRHGEVAAISEEAEDPPFAAYWGEDTTSSSDGQYFKTGGWA
jgi:hypothetical protein